jgi:hypothetical protein
MAGTSCLTEMGSITSFRECDSHFRSNLNIGHIAAPHQLTRRAIFGLPHPAPPGSSGGALFARRGPVSAAKLLTRDEAREARRIAVSFATLPEFARRARPQRKRTPAAHTAGVLVVLPMHRPQMPESRWRSFVIMIREFGSQQKRRPRHLHGCRCEGRYEVNAGRAGRASGHVAQIALGTRANYKFL